MTTEEMEEILRHIADREVRDSRMTALQSWFTITVGTVGVAVVGWGVKNINDLNQNLAVMGSRFGYEIERTNRVERHLETVDGRVVILERKVK